LTRQTRNLAISLAIAAVVASGGACSSGRETPPETGDLKVRPAPEADLKVRTTSARGGDLIVSLRSDPQSFNWITRRDSSAYLVTLLTQAWLVRVNRLTDTVEPVLAESWAASPDGLRYTIKLRQGVTFSDGAPFTSDDVVFSLAAAYDEKGGSMIADSMRVGGKNLTAEAVDPATVVVTFPGPFGPGLRLFDNLPMLPRHKLGGALGVDGGLAAAWRTSANPADLTGLGPFTIAEYAAGRRLVFARNPRYFRKGAGGAQLPFVDRVVVEIVADQSAETLRLESGQVDVSANEIRLEDYAIFKRAADAGRLKLYDVGVAVSADSLWFNLKPGAFKGDPRAAWIQRDELRKAISLAVDRKAFVDTVYLGAGVPVFGPVTPGNKAWYAPGLPQPAHDPAKAKALLASIGLADRNGDGVLEDAANRPARFTLLTAKGQTALERGVSVVRDELAKIGLGVDTVLLDANALVGTFLGGKPYDAVYFGLIPSDTDPALILDFWLSSGGSHLWNAGQASPATAWERQIDQLMAKQAAALDQGERYTLFTEVQKIFAEHEPMVYFAAPRIYVATSARVLNIDPMPRRPQALWSPDTIALRR
jgi:peptide/nickel transport system substrate-binding protein